MRKPRTDLFCRNADGDIVILSKIWKGYSKNHTAVTLYSVRGRKDKMIRLLHRAEFAKAVHTDEMLVAARDTVAHLWAMQNEVSDYVVVYTSPKTGDLYHPDELQQEKQP